MTEGYSYTEEILCDISKAATPYGAGYTDCPEMISEDLARKAYSKAMAYRIECDVSKDFDNENIKEFPAQAGLLRADLLIPSPGRGDGVGGGRYRVVPVTAKHNMKADLGRELMGTKMYSHALGQCKRIRFPEMGLVALETPLILKGSEEEDTDVRLPFGLDFTFGTVIENPGNDFTSVLTSFAVVRHDFKITKGQKIGVAVWRNHARVTNEGTIGQLSQEEEAKYYGPPNMPVIQTGVITAVYGNGAVFGHSINTYEGCSGATIFLLDNDQPPESVERHDWGRAIGIHAAGYFPHNLGMSIIHEFHHMTNPDLRSLR
jgi:hypothetical protein